MMVVPSWSIKLILGGTEQERDLGEMPFYMEGVVMIWHSYQTNENDNARSDKRRRYS